MKYVNAERHQEDKYRCGYVKLQKMIFKIELNDNATRTTANMTFNDANSVRRICF